MYDRFFQHLWFWGKSESLGWTTNKLWDKRRGSDAQNGVKVWLKRFRPLLAVLHFRQPVESIYIPGFADNNNWGCGMRVVGITASMGFSGVANSSDVSLFSRSSPHNLFIHNNKHSRQCTKGRKLTELIVVGSSSLPLPVIVTFHAEEPLIFAIHACISINLTFQHTSLYFPIIKVGEWGPVRL